MILIQNYYKDKYEYRHSEIEKCLQMNCDNPHISKVVLLIETDVTPETVSDKIEIIRVPSRPTYSELFKAANDASQPNDIVIISNSDIYFNESLNEAYNIGSDECYALSRWNMVGGRLKPFHYPDSQDVWIMRSPIKEMEADFTSGVPGCDNKIAYILDQSGYTVTNPCSKIIAIHLHDGDRHNYTAKDRVPPPYLRVTPQ